MLRPKRSSRQISCYITDKCGFVISEATAQIFPELSPEMHCEFVLKHEMRWLQRWDLTYGCRKPLYGRADLLRRIPIKDSQTSRVEFPQKRSEFIISQLAVDDGSFPGLLYLLNVTNKRFRIPDTCFSIQRYLDSA